VSWGKDFSSGERNFVLFGVKNKELMIDFFKQIQRFVKGVIVRGQLEKRLRVNIKVPFIRVNDMSISLKTGIDNNSETRFI
jgi:hypothetical protein